MKKHGPSEVVEKPKNFKMAFNGLIKNLKGFRILIVFALILSIIGALFSIVGPNKISDLVNEISYGLTPNSKNLNILINDIYSDKDIVIDNVKISYSDKIALIQTMSKYDKNSKDIYKDIDKLPDSIKEVLKPKMNTNNIIKISIFLVILYLLSALFNFLQGFIMSTVSNNFSRSLRSKAIEKINKLPLRFFDKNTTGDILSRITNDIDTINMSLHNSLSSIVSALTLFIGSIIMMFVTNPTMALVAILSSLFGFIFMFIILSKSQKYFRNRQIELGKLNGHIEEVYSNHLIVKVYNGEKEAKEKFDKLNEAVYESNRKSQFLSGLMMPLMGFIGNFGYVCVCICGAILVVNGRIDFGVIVAFMIYVRLFINPLSQIAQGFTNLQTTFAASERVFEFLGEEEVSLVEPKKVLDPKSVKGSVTFSHVKFGYTKEKIIINDFNFVVKPGEKIAIVGPTGAGKTTLVNLLMKFYDLNSGDILIDGISLNDLSRKNISSLFTMVLKDTWLFNGTIRDNIKYNHDVSDEEIYKALSNVGIDRFVKSLPGALDYEIKDQDNISSGQKQLLTIARGMILDTPFLILDEATSSVDTRTEELVQKAMDKLTKGKTSFIIAHRLSTIKNADVILVMKDGNIVENGSHEELLKKDGVYKELYMSQFKD